jgi:ribonuclease P protein component
VTALVSIPSRAGFLAARDSGIKAVSRGFVLQAVPTGRPDWRLGLTASRKVGNAVRRNRARRRLRALARTELAMRARPGTDYVMIARHGTADRDWTDLVRDLGKAVGYLHRTMDSTMDRTMERIIEHRGNGPAGVS